MGENELMTLGDVSENSLVKATDERFAKLQSGAFLPRLQLMTANADKCKSGEFPTNHYALIRDQNYRDLGKSVDVLICNWRPLALEIGEEIIACHDEESDLFKTIQARANEKIDGNLWGFQYLLWVPAAETFATFFCGSPTARRAAPHINALLTKAATLGSQKITGKGKNPHTWFGPTAVECSTPFDMPTRSDFDREMEKFNNPPKQEVQMAEEEDEQRPQ